MKEAARLLNFTGNNAEKETKTYGEKVKLLLLCLVILKTAPDSKNGKLLIFPD